MGTELDPWYPWENLCVVACISDLRTGKGEIGGFLGIMAIRPSLHSELQEVLVREPVPKTNKQTNKQSNKQPKPGAGEMFIS